VYFAPSAVKCVFGFTMIATLLLALAAGPPGSVAQLANATELREKLGVPLVVGHESRLAELRVAVLDFGFAGIDPQRPCLPATAELVEHYDAEWVKRNELGDPTFRKGFEPGNPHGRLMAQTIWAVTGSKAEGPKFYLLNANGPTLFRRAIRYAVEQKVNVILFSGHFEGGGNGDGKGSLNAAVDEAIQAGILWANAAGNHHGRVYAGPIRSNDHGDVRFGASTALFLTNRLDENTLTITLTWNDYRDAEDAGTTKDLDLFLDDANGTAIASSQLTQIAGDKPAGANETRNPRERLTIPDLARGTYRLRVVDRSRNFRDADRLRILISPSRSDPFPHPDTNKLTNPIALTDATNAEELYPPADHPRVITVGERGDESAMGPTTDRRLKPDVILPAVPAKWSNGEITGGTSYAAAYFAGIAVQQLAGDRGTTANDWMRWFAKNRTKDRQGRPQPVTWKMPSAAEWATIRGPGK
jgi:hypothetical protein